MATFILIHGAWHGGWCWENLTPLLADAGHCVLAPDLPGMGADDRLLGPDPIGEWADFTAGLAREAMGPTILVGHSRGGLVISEAAERAPDRIDRLVYLTAFLLERGQSLADIAGRYPEVGPGAAVRPAGDPSRLALDPDAAIPIFYSDYKPEAARYAAERLVSEPIAALTRPASVTAERFGSVRRSYIEATRDRAISLVMQREMRAALPCETVATLTSDHSPF